MRRLVVLVVVASMLCIEPAPAADGPPDSFRYVSADVSGFGTITITWEISSLVDAAMMVTEFSDAQGTVSFVAYELFSQGESSAFEARIDDSSTTVLLTDPLPFNAQNQSVIHHGDGAWQRFRFGVATWGGEAIVEIDVDGVILPLTSADPARVTTARKMEFSGGAAAAAGPADAAVASSYAYHGRNHIAGYLLAGSFGAGSITGPSGTRSVSVAAPDGHIAEDGEGEWSFEITAAADMPAGNTPVLWLMDFPA